MDAPFLLDVLRRLMAGAPLTLKLAGLSIGMGLIAATALAVAVHAGPRLLAWPIRGFVAIFRGTPLLVQIFLIYYGLGQFHPFLQAVGLWGFFREPFWCAILALTLNTSAYGTEIIRGGLQSVPHGQIEAARACGMSPWLLYRRIVLPIAVRQALPSYGNEIVLMIKGTSLASIITLAEITSLAQQIISQTYRAIEVFACAGALYLAMNFVVTRLVGWLEHRLSPHLRAAPDLERSPSPQGAQA